MFNDISSKSEILNSFFILLISPSSTKSLLFPIINNFNYLNLDINLNMKELEDYYIEKNRMKEDFINFATIENNFQKLYKNEKISKDPNHLEKVSNLMKINPISIFNLIEEYELINNIDFRNEIHNYISFLILELLKEESLGIIIIKNPLERQVVVKMLLKKFDLIFGIENTDSIHKQINNALGKTIDLWIEKDFFKNHISQFKKRPIIWHLSSEGKSFQCFIDYHKLSQNLLIILRNRYIEKRLTILKEESKNITESLKNELSDSKIKGYNKKYIVIEDSIEDLQKFSENLKNIIDMNIEFGEDKGVKQQILPFQRNSLLAIKKVV